MTSPNNPLLGAVGTKPGASPKPFHEHGPPYDPQHTTIPYSRLNGLLAPQKQWALFACIWAVLLFWMPTYYFDIFPYPSTMWHINNVLPVLVLFVFAYPMGYGLLGWTPPKIGCIMYALNLVSPFVCAHFRILIPYLCGFVGTVIITFAWLSIHGSDMTNAPWNESTWWAWVVGVPSLLGIMNALMYAWQYRAGEYSISPQFRFLMEGTLFLHYAADVLILFAKEVLNKNVFDLNEYRIYNLNDVQYIRLNTMRVCLFIAAYYGMARGLEYVVFFELEQYQTEWLSTHNITLGA